MVVDAKGLLASPVGLHRRAKAQQVGNDNGRRSPQRVIRRAEKSLAPRNPVHKDDHRIAATKNPYSEATRLSLRSGAGPPRCCGRGCSLANHPDLLCATSAERLLSAIRWLDPLLKSSPPDRVIWPPAPIPQRSLRCTEIGFHTHDTLNTKCAINADEMNVPKSTKMATTRIFQPDRFKISISNRLMAIPA